MIPATLATLATPATCLTMKPAPFPSLSRPSVLALAAWTALAALVCPCPTARGQRPSAPSLGERPALDGSVSPVAGEEDKVVIQFPNTPVSDILDIYERLIGKPLVRDSQIYRGPNITLMPPKPVSREEACRLIESALLINGYLLLPGPEGSLKVVLNDPRQKQNPLREGIAIYTDPAQLPAGDAIAAFFLPLDFLSPDDAKALFETHVQLNDYGKITPIYAPPALLITENVSMIRQIVALKPLVDVDPALSQPPVKTEIVEIKYADAVAVADMIQALVDNRPATPGSPPRPAARSGSSGSGKPASTPARSTARRVIDQNQLLNIHAQLIADSRLNRILVVTEPANFDYIHGLIEQLDQPLELKPPLERRLKYVTAEDILPVLVNILSDNADDPSAQTGAGAPLGSRLGSRTSAAIPRSRTGNRGGSFTNASGVDSLPDQLTEPVEDVAPLSVQIGKTRLIADRQANAIFVVGPPESYAKVSTIIDRLDRKPPQVYLATIIGQLTLDDSSQTGVDYLLHFNNRDLSGGLLAKGGLAGAVSDLRQGIGSAVTPAAGGLTVFGSVTKNLDVLVRALESTNRFKVLSRPTVYAANNKKAVITSGQQIPVPTNVLQSLDSNSSRFQTNIDYRDVVLKLEVIPLINSRKEVTLKIAQVNDTVVGEQTVSENTVPIIGTERLNTTVTIPNANTVVLGGLITEQLEKKATGVPLLKDIPLLGHAFRSNSTSKVRRELVIFIQPIVVEDEETASEASRKEDARTMIGAEAASVFPEAGQVHLPGSGKPEPAPRGARQNAKPPAK